MRTDMDYLVIGECLFDKKAQTILPDDGSWKKEYELD
jgi:carbamoyltransferase